MRSKFNYIVRLKPALSIFDRETDDQFGLALQSTGGNNMRFEHLVLLDLSLHAAGPIVRLALLYMWMCTALLSH